MEWTIDSSTGDWFVRWSAEITINVWRRDERGLWRWRARFAHADKIFQVNMDSVAETADQAKSAAEKAANCVDLAVREFVK
jgi:hypothetical protein